MAYFCDLSDTATWVLWISSGTWQVGIHGLREIRAKARVLGLPGHPHLLIHLSFLAHEPYLGRYSRCFLILVISWSLRLDLLDPVIRSARGGLWLHLIFTSTFLYFDFNSVCLHSLHFPRSLIRPWLPIHRPWSTNALPPSFPMVSGPAVRDEFTLACPLIPSLLVGGYRVADIASFEMAESIR